MIPWFREGLVVVSGERVGARRRQFSCVGGGVEEGRERTRGSRSHSCWELREQQESWLPRSLSGLRGWRLLQQGVLSGSVHQERNDTRCLMHSRSLISNAHQVLNPSVQCHV